MWEPDRPLPAQGGNRSPWTLQSHSSAEQQPATPGLQPGELGSSFLRRLHWRSEQSVRNLLIILLIKPSDNKNKTLLALGRACCQLIANCCVTEWNWDVNTSLRCIPYSHAGSVSSSDCGKLHFTTFADSNVHFTNCQFVLHQPAHHPQVLTCV